MNKFSTLLILILISTFSFGQNAKTKGMLKEIYGQWSLDDNGNVTYVQVVDAPDLSKDEIYTRVLDYFVYSYGSGKSVIQTQDKELGRVVGKGLYNNVHIGISIITTYIDCWHIVRVDVREGRARIILTLTKYDKKKVGGDTPPSYSTMKVENEFPINPKGYSKTVMGKAFYKSHKAALASMSAIEKAIKEGSTFKGVDDEW